MVYCNVQCVGGGGCTVPSSGVAGGGCTVTSSGVAGGGCTVPRVSSETSFVSKQPKLEPKLVSALSETRRLFRFNIKTGSFGVSKQPKQTKD
jgi:hypothetical protein